MNDEVTFEEEVVESTENEATEGQEVDELQEVFDSWVEAGKSDDDMIEALHNEHELSYPQAITRLRELKKAAGMGRRPGHKKEEVQAFIQECIDNEMSRSDIIEAMVEKFGYTKNSAASTFSVQARAMGIIAEGEGVRASKKPLNEVVAFARAHANDKRADFVEAMVEELGYSESTAGAFYTYLGFAKEYARQECEENS